MTSQERNQKIKSYIHQYLNDTFFLFLDQGAVCICILFSAILQNFAHLLRPNGFVLLEIGFDQAAAVTALAHAAGFSDCKTLRDYGGNDRVVLCQGFSAQSTNP